MVYDQVDFLGNPLVSEVTIVKANHDAYNKTQPYNTATFRPQTEAFVTSFNRPQALAHAARQRALSRHPHRGRDQAARTAGWLSWALANGYGRPQADRRRRRSRALRDLQLVPESRRTRTARRSQLPLCTDNVGANDKAFSPTFPYLAAPILCERGGAPGSQFAISLRFSAHHASTSLDHHRRCARRLAVPLVGCPLRRDAATTSGRAAYRCSRAARTACRRHPRTDISSTSAASRETLQSAIDRSIARRLTCSARARR